LCFGLAPSYAQSAAQMDAKVVYYLGRIDYWRQSSSDGAIDSLTSVNDSLEHYFLKVLSLKAAVTADFKKSKEAGLDCISSEDGKVRFYDWDTWTGGTMHIFTDLAQNRTTHGAAVMRIVDTTSEGDPGCFYTNVYSTKTANGTIYMVLYGVIGSNRDKGEGIAAYAIQNDTLVHKPVFHTATKLLDHIEYGYDFTLVADIEGERPGIHFSPDMQKLYIPVVKENGAFTKTFLVYAFDGNNYVFDKNLK